MTELYNQYREVLDETLDYNKVETVNALVEMYNQPGMSAFAGNILRIYARSSKLVGAFENMEVLQKLTTLITNADFSIQSDSYETFKEILLYDREGDTAPFEGFLISNSEAIFKLFDQLEGDSNYFSKPEGLKTQYMLLVKKESLRKIYTSDKERLKAIMVTVLNQNKAIQYEAFLLLSLFILMPLENQAVRYILEMNKGNLKDFIKNFQHDREEQEFKALKNKMREILDDM